MHARSERELGVRDPLLIRLLGEVAEVSEATRALREELSEKQLTWRPAVGVWSIAECFAHLTVTGELYYPRIEECIAGASPFEAGPGKEFRPRWLAQRFILAVTPGSKFRLTAPKRFRPRQKAIPASALDEFLEQEKTLGELIEHADGRDLRRARFASPITRLLRFSIGEGLLLMVTHQRRHLLQAQHLREHGSFPSE